MADPGPSLPPELEAALAEAHKFHGATRDQRLAELRKANPEHATAIDQRVEDLKSEHASAATLPPAGAAASASPTTERSTQIGPYKILSTLGEGGMGSVYLAEQKEPVRRRVALKVIKLGMDSKQVVARFALERQALAVMNHPAIAKVFDAGTTDQGQPYFVMELVDGIPLTDYCDQHRLTLKERIHVFQQVCQGVQHAHQKGVLHRDLKPGNILVSRKDDQHVVKIIDFGLARATDQQMVAQTIFTEQGQFLGTPEYMSPEQAGGSNLDIDTRTDIYSLGVILYELLAGELPFSSKDLRQAGLLEIQRILVEQEPAKPSTKISSVGESATELAKHRRLASGALAKRLRGELDWIVMRAMAKEPERRYESAFGLALDLTRYLENEPVLAGPPSAAYRLSKMMRRYRVQVVAAALVVAVSIVGALVAWQFAMEVREENSRFDRLSVVVQLQDAQSELKGLQPAWPAQIATMKRWLDERGDRLESELPRVRQALAKLEPDATTTTTTTTDGATRTDRSARERETFLQKTLTRVEKDLTEFLGANGARVDVQRRLKWAEQIEALTKSHPGAPTTWADAREALRKADGIVASVLYGAKHHEDHPIELQTQLGLVPIGMNPKTKLWEFYHLRSAIDPRTDGDPTAIAIPRHGADGSIPVADDTGIVFVLLPGGTYTMGAQNTDPNGPNFDPQAKDDERPHEETVAPFFLARHELTQGQWVRLSLQANPSRYLPGTRVPPKPISLRHPVEQVDWHMATALLAKHGLQLPHEIEWEYGCRGGKPTPWSCGKTALDLSGWANIRDAMAVKHLPLKGTDVSFDDRHAIHAPVGTYAANPFGLHDVHGNIVEWCRNQYGNSARHRVARGGGFLDIAQNSRSAARGSDTPTVREASLGLRPARSLH